MKLENFSNNQEEIIKSVGYQIGDKEYSIDEINMLKIAVMDYAISKSLKSEKTAQTLNDSINICNILDARLD